MARKERKIDSEERLDGLLTAGDWHQARVEADALASSGTETDRGVAARARTRLRPGPTAVWAFVGGLAFLAVVAIAGLWNR